MNYQSPAFQPIMPVSQQADRGNLTNLDLSTHLDGVAGKGGLNVQFFYARSRVESANPERNGQWRTRLCVAKMPKGDRLTIATRFITEEQAMREFPREFSMFKQYQDVPTQGTPLHELPGITQSQIAVLVVHNLRCIEDVAACDDALVNGMGYDARQAKKLAVRWLENVRGNTELINSATVDAARDAENARLRKQAEDMERRNIELEAQLKAVMQMQGQAPAGAVAGGPGMLGGPFMVDRPDDLPDALDVESNFGEGGLVTGNDDLNDEPETVKPSKADPLGLKAGK